MLSWNALHFTEAEEQRNHIKYVCIALLIMCLIHSIGSSTIFSAVEALTHTSFVFTDLLLVPLLAYLYCLWMMQAEEEALHYIFSSDFYKYAMYDLSLPDFFYITTISQLLQILLR